MVKFCLCFLSLPLLNLQLTKAESTTFIRRSDTCAFNVGFTKDIFHEPAGFLLDSRGAGELTADLEKRIDNENDDSYTCPVINRNGEKSDDNLQTISQCCSDIEMKQVQNELVHKWQFVNRNLNDRTEALESYRPQLAGIPEDYCMHAILKTHMDGLDAANKLQEELANLLLSTESFVLCSLCFREDPPDNRFDELKRLGNDLNEWYELEKIRKEKNKIEKNGDPLSEADAHRLTLRETIPPDLLKAMLPNVQSYIDSVSKESTSSSIRNQSSSYAEQWKRIQRRDTKLAQEWKRLSINQEELYSKVIENDKNILDFAKRAIEIEDIARAEHAEGKDIDDESRKHFGLMHCDFSYLHALVDGKAFKSHHEFPKNDNPKTSRKWFDFALQHADQSKELEHEENLDDKNPNPLWFLIKPWVDAAMSMILEVGNLLMHQIEVILLTMYHLGRKGSWAHPLLLASPQSDINEPISPLFMITRKRMVAGGSDLGNPYCRTHKEIELYSKNGFESLDSGSVASILRMERTRISVFANDFSGFSGVSSKCFMAYDTDVDWYQSFRLKSKLISDTRKGISETKVTKSKKEDDNVPLELRDTLTQRPPSLAVILNVPGKGYLSKESLHAHKLVLDKFRKEWKSRRLESRLDRARELLMRIRNHQHKEQNKQTNETSSTKQSYSTTSFGSLQPDASDDVFVLVFSREDKISELWNPNSDEVNDDQNTLLVWRRFILYNPKDLIGRYLPFSGLPKILWNCTDDSSPKALERFLSAYIHGSFPTTAETAISTSFQPYLLTISPSYVGPQFSFNDDKTRLHFSRAAHHDHDAAISHLNGTSSELVQSSTNNLPLVMPSLDSDVEQSERSNWLQYDIRWWMKPSQNEIELDGQIDPHMQLFQKKSVLQIGKETISSTMGTLVDFLIQQQSSAKRILVYRCTSIGFCGGHGDRMHGLLGLFLLSIVTNRKFYIDSPRPLPLPLLLKPRFVDWRMRGTVGLPGVHANRNDKFWEAIGDLHMADSDEPVLVFHSNQRISMPVLQSNIAKKNIPSDILNMLLSTPFLHAHLFEFLFEPTQLLTQRIGAWWNYLRGGSIQSIQSKELRPMIGSVSVSDLQLSVHAAKTLNSNQTSTENVENKNITTFFNKANSTTFAKNRIRHLIGIHFRTGDESKSRWRDPKRHSRQQLLEFLTCAEKVQTLLGYAPEETRFFLAADATTESWEELDYLYKTGKLIGPGYKTEDQRKKEKNTDVIDYFKKKQMKMLSDSDSKNETETKNEELHTNAVVHLDRSSLSLLVVGLADVWSQWWSIGHTVDALILSSSGFGVTAGEIGRQTNTFYGEGCVAADLSAV